MGPFSFPAKVEDKAVRKRAIDLLREKGVRLPTFAELAEPASRPAAAARLALDRPGRSPSAAISTASTGTTTPDAPATSPCRCMSSCPRR